MNLPRRGAVLEATGNNVAAIIEPAVTGSPPFLSPSSASPSLFLSGSDSELRLKYESVNLLARAFWQRTASAPGIWP